MGNVSSPPPNVTLHPVEAGDSTAVNAAVEVYLAARHAGVPDIPPLIHPDDDVRRWFRDQVVPNEDVWVARQSSLTLAMLVMTDGWIEHLYVKPGHTSAGVGSELIRHAKSRHDTLELWTFAANLGAQRFYRRHGFVETERTDGENEEGAPDIRYQWSR